MANEMECCPTLIDGKKCDYLDFVYRLTNYTNVNADNRDQRVAVEVALHLRVERCTDDLELGNLVYSTTLLPGEKVRLYTQDRKSRFSFDSESQLSYRHEQSSEEQYYMESFESFMSDLESRDQSGASATTSGSASSKGETSGLFGTLINGPSVSVSGSFNGASTRDFLRELNVHAESSHNRSVQMTREASSTQIGEVQTRQHAEGESENHFESSSRFFQNRNKCHAVSYLFYQVNKRQTTRVTIKAVNTRVIDPVAKSDVVNNAVVADRKFSIIPTAVLATSDKVELNLQQSEKIQLARTANLKAVPLTFSNFQLNAQPISSSVRVAALKNVNADLLQSGILTKDGKVSSETSKEMNFEFTTTIPTPGIVVKGCLDECDTCEDSRKLSIELDLKNKALQNNLLAKQIELLGQSQEYRCCPVGEIEELEEA